MYWYHHFGQVWILINNYFEIWHIHSLSPEDESYWPCVFHQTAREGQKDHIQWNISISATVFGPKFGTGILCPKRMIYTDFGSHLSFHSVALERKHSHSFSEISQHQLDRLVQNLLQTLMFPRGWTVITWVHCSEMSKLSEYSDIFASRWTKLKFCRLLWGWVHPFYTLKCVFQQGTTMILIHSLWSVSNKWSNSIQHYFWTYAVLLYKTC